MNAKNKAVEKKKEPTYKAMRYFSSNRKPQVYRTGLSLKDAQSIAQLGPRKEGKYFTGYTQE